MKNSQRNRIRSRTVEIRKAISSMDLLASGTLHTRTKVCGRRNCRCATDPTARHGPYFEWNRRIDGRIVHKVLSKEQAELINRAIGNQREVKRLLLLWERETEDEILALGNARKPRKSSK